MRNDGVSPEFRNNLDRNRSRNNETRGLSEKTRLILLMSVSGDLPAIEEPNADAISQEPRNVPVISSYPPAIFIISLINRNCIEELTKPTINRFELIFT
jgi:hypothetical protein